MVAFSFEVLFIETDSIISGYIVPVLNHFTLLINLSIKKSSIKTLPNDFRLDHLLPQKSNDPESSLHSSLYIDPTALKLVLLA
jgi:hypothetical protein